MSATLAMKIHCLTTGAVRPKAGRRGLRRYLLPRWDEHTLPVNLFVVVHPRGVCLFDSGQTWRATEPGYLPQWHPFLRLARFELTREDEAAAQLRRLGIQPEQVRWLVLSHMHTDHVGGVSAFADAEILVSRVEWGIARGLPGRIRGYLPQHWPPGLSPALVDFNGPPLGPFPASYDLTGDGALTLVPTPGHTRGHLSMVVQTQAGRFLCCGDVANDADELSETAPAIGSFCRSEGITVLSAHDRQAASMLP
jgi:glyoxylase-like metal-dependent hydrolase (beta-lactamase superfamily II)